MAVLQDLSDEILVEIIKLSNCNKTTILNVAAASNKLNGLATQILARDIDIYVQTPDQALARKYDMLMSSLIKRSDLNLFVRTVTIRCREDGGRKSQRKKNANLRANELLKRLPKIKSLCIDWEDRNSTFLPDYLEHTEHPHLRDITFLGWKTPLDGVCDYMRAINLSSIVVSAIDPDSRVSSPHVKRRSAGSDGPNLSRLDLGRPHLPHSELHKILELASSITTLQCAIPGVEASLGFMPIRLVRTPMKTTLSPALIAQSLSPLRACLVHLNLGDGVATHWPSHDGTQLDLSKFICLETLNVMSTCFFKESPKVHRSGVRDLLPPSLEQISLWFPFDSHFLYSNNELSQWFPDKQYSHHLESQHSSRYGWLSELIEAHILDNEPFRLRKITITEQIKGPKGFGYGRHCWELPLHLRKVCDSAELNLTALLRKPKFRGDGLY